MWYDDSEMSTNSLGKKIVDALKQHSGAEIEPEAVLTPPDAPAVMPAPDSVANFSAVPPVMPAVQPVAAEQADDDEFDTPANVKVLKQLMTQLPPGITKQTGAAVVKQTMEALGIPIKSVLQEAQAFQENLSALADENKANIESCKQQIADAESIIKKIQKQHNTLHDIISLFVQIS